MNWLITGGCGFIGKNLLKVLVEFDKDWSVRILDNLSVGTKEDLYYAVPSECVVENDSLEWEKGKVQLFVGDILDDSRSLAAGTGADAVVRLAANTGIPSSVADPKMDCVTNVIGTLNMLESCRKNGIKKFVFASSGAPVGECTPPVHEELPCHPVSPYGASKLAGEGYCSTYYHTFKIDTVALRFGNVYGPGSSNKGSVVAKFIKQIFAGETLEIYGDGSQTRDFIYIGDLVKSILLAATKPNVGGNIFQIATNKETDLTTLTNSLVKVMESKDMKNIKVINGEKRLGDVMRNFSDTSKAKNVLGWTVEETLDSGLEKTVDWFVDAYAKV